MSAKERPEADEIEITPKMVEAGLVELYRFSRDSDEVDCFKKIYRAMASAACPSTETQPGP
jgi:hypothetical protein